MKKRILTLALAVLVITTLLTTAAFAENGTLDTGLQWDFTGGTLTISGTGAMPAFPSADDTPWKDHNSEITAISIADGVTSIGDNAFAGTQVTSITIPASVTSLGSNALPSTLTSITAPCKLKDSLPSGITQTLKHNSNPTHHPQDDPSPTENGMKEYWMCSDCGLMFSDSACENKIDDASTLIIPKTDTEGPIFGGLIPSRNTVSPPSSVDVMVVATDALSGVKSGTVTFTNSKNGTSIGPVELKLSGGSLSGTLNFSATAPSGDYYINSITLVDNANNQKTYSNLELPSAYRDVKITVVRTSKISTIGTLTLNAATAGYGGSVTGTIVLKDVSGNPLPNKSLDIYVGTLKTTIVATTDENGTATFKYSNTIPGTYTLMAKFLGDEDYNTCDTNTVTVTFTSVPATGDSYDIQLWVFVAIMAITVNAWFIINRKKA